MTGDGYSYAELKQVADEVRDELLRVSDVAKVDIYGAQNERIFVDYDNARLAELGLSPLQLRSILDSANIIIPGGSIRTGVERIALEPTGNFESVADLRRTVVTLPGRPEIVFLEDLAAISRGYVDPPASRVYASGGPRARARHRHARRRQHDHPRGRGGSGDRAPAGDLSHRRRFRRRRLYSRRSSSARSGSSWSISGRRLPSSWP